ncbi:Cytosine/adenosine deaminase [Paracoccus alcaliphilus]|uniref:Cytosine/adenosine deaminase n=1 Tax=Paracoccus alcaliphilus TaxID=34002 RepID=A0A1H8EYX3_9RHOB|nr:amidohydrolase family protein [Paracoccus alcaliphilus]WCR20084.1 amidohydrolase family protein [Paracoccus alcaliphilus]SEN24791.1 Cytosine/adenosine deaminase [Paracoccus alcaliphilus]
MTDKPRIFDDTQDLLILPGQMLLDEGTRPGMAVLLRDGRFAEVGPVGELTARHPEMRRIELPHHLLMPGFIDSHTHLTQSLGKSLVFGEPSEIFRRIWVPLEGSLDEHMVHLSSRLAALECLRGGFTTAVDAGTRSAGHIGRLVDAARESGLRLVVAQICNDLGGAALLPDPAEITATAGRHLAAYDGDPLIHPSLAISIPEVGSDDMLRRISAMAGEAGAIFQTHVNEHLVAVERSLVANGRRPLEHLAHIGALGPHALIAHATLVTPSELNILRDTGTAIAYNPVASVWKGNAIAPAVQMQALGVRFGLGTDGTRADGFRLMDAAETLQRTGYGLASGDSSCGGGWLWLDAATRMAADASGLAGVTGRIAPGLAADFLLVDLDLPEFTPSHDLTWELVRYGNRDQIDAVFTNGRLRMWQGWPVDWDASALLAEIREVTAAAIAQAPIQRIHPVADRHRAMTRQS